MVKLQATQHRQIAYWNCTSGVVSFISKGWGGHVSDAYLTENCGLLHYLLPGDLVLADRVFTIEENVGMYCAEVKIPPFTKKTTK